MGFVGLEWVRRGHRATIVPVMACLLAGWIFSLPVTGHGLMRLLGTDSLCPPIDTLEGKADAIVILGGGMRERAPEYAERPEISSNALERLRHAARLQKRTGVPILVSGGSPHGRTAEAVVMGETLLVDFGIRARWVEEGSRTTRENASGSALILKGAGIQRIYLVSQGWHLARAVPAFERVGFRVIPSGTGCEAHEPPGPIDFLPSPHGVELNYWAIHEWLGGLWYQLMGV